MEADNSTRVLEEAKKYIKDELKLEILDTIGKGAYANVFAAVDEKKQKHAVKVCVKPPDVPYIAEYLDREIEILKEIKHPNIVQMYNGVSLKEFTVIDMELCDMTLDDFISEKLPDGGKRMRTLSETEVRAIAKQLTCGVNALHDKGIAHRDIKPTNILVVKNEDGTFTFKISGFVLAKRESDGLNDIVGTPLYMAPEVFNVSESESRRYTCRCDMWSLGIMYYILLTNRSPFPCTKRDDIKCAMTCDEPSGFCLPKELEVSESFRDFVNRHLIKNPEKRISAKDAMKHPFIVDEASGDEKK